MWNILDVTNSIGDLAMKTAKVSLFFLFLFTSIALGSVTIAEVYNAKDVVAARYYQKVGLIDLNTGTEITLDTDYDIIDLVWDKQAKNLFVLYSVNIPGPNYDSPDRNEVRLYEFSLPANTKTLLKTIKVPEPADYNSYSYPTMALDKKGNPVITLHYGISQQTYMRYTYDTVAKTLSNPVKTTFSIYQDGFKRKNQPTIGTTPGKCFNEASGKDYNLYFKQGEEDILLSDRKLLKYSYDIAPEPFRYCVSPDSSFVVFGYRLEDELDFGCTYIWSQISGDINLVSNEGYLGESFIPAWISGGRMLYLQPTDSYFGAKKPSLKTVEQGGRIRDIKVWPTEDEGPLEIQHRVK